MLVFIAAASALPGAAEPTWESTLERVVPGIVAIRVSSTRAFDTEGTSSSVATGFVVDAKRGIILTNRHVVEPGPVVAEAVFYNHEEVPLRPIYRDPVHDFGFYQFDPKDLRFLALTELPLEPAHARVGVELRVAGNDAGEKISILQGTLARLDRDAPSYGEGRFNDFDTFYYQAASGTSGGSSGSPVLDIHGHVIALNAGGSTSAASSFYLPLDRVVRALDAVRAGQPVPRGTIQTVFRYRTYDEVRRLGAREQTERASRALFPDSTGMLVVDQVIPGGPAFDRLFPGDVIVTVDGAPVNRFIPWESVLDTKVGATIALGVERGGAPIDLTLDVQDLHAITPNTYLEVGGGVLNPFSFQEARSRSLPLSTGVWVASAGYALANAGIPDDTLIIGVDGVETRTLDAVESALSKLPDQRRFSVRWIDPREPRRAQVAVVTMDRRWFPMQRCTRDDRTGVWPCTPTPLPPKPAPDPAAPGILPAAEGSPARGLAPSLVWVSNTIPYRAEGVYSGNFSGTGVVIDDARGLVLVDRDTVPIALSDVMLTFAGTVRVPAKVAWIHPLHNLAVVQYDVAAVGATPVRSVRWSNKTLKAGTRTFHVGLTARQELLQEGTRLTGPEPLLLAIPRPPFFRERNLDAFGVEKAAPVVGGVLADSGGRVLGFWASFIESRGDKPTAVFRAIPAEILNDFLDPLTSGQEPTLRGIGAELSVMPLAAARDLGLSAERAAQLTKADPRRRQVLWVARLEAGTAAAGLLREGDLVVTVNGEIATRFRDVERASTAELIQLQIVRDGVESGVTLPTTAVDGKGVDRVVVWAGAVLHAPHAPLAADYGLAPEGIYVSWTWNGSPAARYALRPTHRILKVDGVPTPDLDAFLLAVRGKPDRAPVRLETADLTGKPQVISLKLDLQYWPTTDLRSGSMGWERFER